MALTADTDELAATWQELGVDLECLEVRDGTLVATYDGEAPAALPALLDALVEGGPPQLELGETLGEGGMGVVHLATQTALQREVAVKSMRPELADEKRQSLLLREARVTGWLEHPNVIPVHALGKDAEGRPILVMKRVEGQVWSALLADGSRDQRMSAPFLRRHLGILQQVANAIDFAHSRGILHRDLKPDNVMIGPFGEVYVLDWGIAVRTREAPLAGVPHVSEVKSIEGTPSYMAPEMVIGHGASITARSDVYLLGATLHHVITGGPPHPGTEVYPILMKAFESVTPSYDPHVPRELGAIAQKAMSRDTASRYAGAAELAKALDDYLLHRGSLELGAQAELRAAELEELLARSEPDPADVEATFNEARFGFEQALRSWPDNRYARTGWRELLESMARAELARGAPRAAERLLRQHDAAPEELVEEVTRALDLERHRSAKLAAFEHDVDQGFGVRHRVALTLYAAAGWAFYCLVCGALTRFDIYPIDHGRFAFVAGLMLVSSVASSIVFRRHMMANATNRRISYSVAMVFALGVVLWPLLGHLGVSMPRTTVVASLVAAALWASVALHQGRIWTPMPVGHVALAILAWFVPAYHFEVFALIAVPVVLVGWLMKRAGALSPVPSTTPNAPGDS